MLIRSCFFPFHHQAEAVQFGKFNGSVLPWKMRQPTSRFALLTTGIMSCD
jgi:hypothetical protein